MRDVPADRILAAQLEAPLRYGPVVDGHVLPAVPGEIFASGKQNDVPMMIGFTRDESFSELARATTLEAWQQSARMLFGNEASALLALYPAKNDAEARRSAMSAARDSTVSLQMRKWAQAQVATGKAPVFAYLFSRVHPYVPGVTFADHDPATVGAYHTGDLPYWLGTLDSLNLFRKTREWSESDRRLSEAMSDAIVAFAKNGSPNVAGKQDWPSYRADREQIREFGDTIRVITWPNVRQLEFFSSNLPMQSAAAPTAQTASAADEPRIDSKPVLEDRYPERRIAFPGNVVSFADLTFSALAGYRPLTLDLYRPSTASTPLPLVIYVHGGGWQSGHTRHSGAFADWPRVLASIAARGYVVASLEYRLSGEARFPAAIQDVKAAIRWLRAHAQQFGIDRQRTVIWGGSAGGQLAALTGTACGIAALDPAGAAAAQRPEPGAAGSVPASTNSAAAARPESDCVQGVIAWYGIFDFATVASETSSTADATNASAAPSRYLGCALGKCSPEVLASASAIHYLDARDPPVLLIHGVNDKTVPVQQSRAYLRALQAKGVSAELIELPGVDHSFIGATPEATRAASLRALEKSLDFIDRTVGKPRSSRPGF
jgi:carboxylesterase type B